MWRETCRLFRVQANSVIVRIERSFKTVLRTPKRILTEQEAVELANKKQGKTKKILRANYTASDLMGDQAARNALEKNKEEKHISKEAAPKEMQSYLKAAIKGKPFVRLNKEDRGTNYRFVELMTMMRSNRQREKTNMVLLEGKRLIIDAILAGCKMQTLIFCDPKVLAEMPLVEGEGEKIQIDRARMATWSLMEAPPGIMAVVERPGAERLAERDRLSRIPLTLIVDRVREPGNMGSIIRTMAAAGCEKILLTKGSCDPWEEKVLRAGMGAHFRVPIYEDIPWRLIPNFIPDNSGIFLADSNSFEVVREAAMIGDSIDPVEDDTDGNETTTNDENADEFGTHAHPTVLVNRAEDGSLLRMESEMQKVDGSIRKMQKLPIYEYHQPRYFDERDHCVLIVGGETASLSATAYHFAHLHRGAKVHISMANNVNSLNTATALGVVAFEIQRQFKEKQSNSNALEGGETRLIEETLAIDDKKIST